MKTNKHLKVLKSLQLANGGILATPKNRAYPYVYIRDGVIITKAFNRNKMWKNSEKFYYFVNKFSKIDHYKEIFHRYNSNGLPSVSRKRENDNEGLLLHGIYDTYMHAKNKSFIENMWPLIEKVSKLIFNYSKSGLVYTERSIHEFYRLEHGRDIWANCACIRGLYDASEIAKILGHENEYLKWKNKAEILKKNMNKQLFNKRLGIYSKNERLKNVPDISQLAPFYFNIIDNKKILKRTLNSLYNAIWHNDTGGFRRFRKFELVEDWHWYTGGSGSWIPFTCWGAKFFKQIGDSKKTKKCLNFLTEVLTKSRGLLPEHIATKEEYDEWKRNEIEFNERILNEAKKSEKNIRKIDGKKIVYWANPLGWSHAEYVLLNEN